MSEFDGESLLSRVAWAGGHADVWRWFDDPETLRAIAAALVEPFRDAATKVAGIESRGFILGAACALELNVGLVPIRKGAGLFPGPKAVIETSADYRGGRQRLRLQRAALGGSERVVLVDDWIETGSQAAGARTLIEECGATYTLLPKARLGGDR